MSLPNRPCGTPEEVEAIGLKASGIPTCAPPNGSKFQGCTMWDFCKCKDREGNRIRGKTPVYEGDKLVKAGGPSYFGVQIAKPVIGRGVGKAQEIMACHVYTQLHHQIRANNGLCQIIAWEGDEFEVRGSKKTAPDATKGDDPTAPWSWKTLTYKVKVPKYPRPADLPELMDISFLHRAKAEEEDEQEAHSARVIGRAVEAKEKAVAATERK